MSGNRPVLLVMDFQHGVVESLFRSFRAHTVAELATAESPSTPSGPDRSTPRYRRGSAIRTRTGSVRACTRGSAARTRKAL